MSDFEQFLNSYPNSVHQLATKARTLIQKTVPEIQEFVDPPSKIIAYGFSKKYSDLVVAIAPYGTYINLIFSMGTQLSDSTKLLEGTGKKARHVKITNETMIGNQALIALIQQATQLIKNKHKTHPT